MFIAALLFDFASVCGIELLPSLHAVAESKWAALERLLAAEGLRDKAPKLAAAASADSASASSSTETSAAIATDSKAKSSASAASHSLPNNERAAAVQLLQSDFFACEDSWAGADVVFVASTAFPDSLMQRLAAACDRLLLKGARVLTLSVPLPSKQFRVSLEEKYRMSWSNVTVFLQTKVA